MTQEAIVTVLGSWVLSLAYTLLLAAGQFHLDPVYLES